MRRAARAALFSLLGCVWAQRTIASEPQTNELRTAPAGEPGARRSSAHPSLDREGPLGSDVADVELALRAFGKTTLLSPMGVERGKPRALALPPSALDERTAGCAAVVAIGAPNLVFSLDYAPTKIEQLRRALPRPSSLGVAEVVRCGARKAALVDLRLESRSERGVVQVLVFEGQTEPPAVASILPRRDAGPAESPPALGGPRLLAPADKRIEGRRKRLLGRGATLAPVQQLPTDERGRAQATLELSPGCHRLDVLGDGDRQTGVDVDAELFDAEGRALGVADDAATADAVLRHCVGVPTRVRLFARGARPRGPLTLSDASWPLPGALPVLWGPLARAAVAEALFDDGMPALGAAPVLSTLGVQGPLRTHVEAASGHCLVVALGSIRGRAERLSLSAESGAMQRQARSLGEPGALGPSASGTHLTICPPTAGPVEIEAEALGSGVATLLAAWELGPSAAPEPSP